MTSIYRKETNLYIDNISLVDIANQFGTPCYVYSKTGIIQRWQAFDRAFTSQPHLVCYAVKTNSNLAILQSLAQQGSGFDIVSGGELARALAAGADPQKIVFSGVGKSKDELRFALLKKIKCFNIESEAELYRLERIAEEEGVAASVSFRVNPDVDPKTHAYISTGLKENKFGVSFDTALRLYQYAHQSEHLSISGIDCHIGSQLLDLAPLKEAAAKVVAFQGKLAALGIHLHHIDMGGGLGINYQDSDNAPSPEAYVYTLIEAINQPSMELLIEPGRSIVGNQGALLTRVEYQKINEGKHFTVVDAAMNDLLRPSLYGAWQEIVEVQQPTPYNPIETDIVGPVCETGDFLGKQRRIDATEGSLLAIMSAGAYGFAMSSNYNTRARAAEVLVENDRVYLVRERETFEHLIAGEHLI
jgi:diaminopimelate decarboxylase